MSHPLRDSSAELTLGASDIPSAERSNVPAELADGTIVAAQSPVHRALELLNERLAVLEHSSDTRILRDALLNLGQQVTRLSERVSAIEQSQRSEFSTLSDDVRSLDAITTEIRDDVQKISQDAATSSSELLAKLARAVEARKVNDTEVRQLRLLIEEKALVTDVLADRIEQDRLNVEQQTHAIVSDVNGINTRMTFSFHSLKSMQAQVIALEKKFESLSKRDTEIADFQSRLVAAFLPDA